MAFNARIKSGDAASQASPALVAMLIGCCSAGTVGGVGGRAYVFDPGDDVATSLGGGPLSDAAYLYTREGNGRIGVMPATPTWSTAPSVAQSGTGPAVTCDLADGASGCFDDHIIKIKVKVGGVGGVAQADVAYDGATYIETIVIPAEPPPSLLGTVDLTGVTLSTLNATTLIFSSPGALTVTFTTPTSVENIATQINTQAIAGSSVVRAEIVQSSTGTKKLRLYTTTGGTGVTLTIDHATSTGEAILGFSVGASNVTATGTAAVMTFPFTGLKFTFPSGTYVKDEIYTAICTGPRASISALVAAATAAKNDYANFQFGFFVVCQPADNATNCKALQDALNTLTKSWIADGTSPVFVTQVVGSPFHTASTTLATNDANIATADAALLAAFAGATANFDSVAHADSYVQGATELRFGYYRRTAALGWGLMRMLAEKIASDVGDGQIPSASLLSPDGVTRARDEGRATTKLGRGNGPGFSCLRSMAAGLGAVKFSPGATRAGSTSRLRYVGAYSVALEIARLVFPELEKWEAQTAPTNPLTGQMADREKARRKDVILGILQPTLVPADAKQGKQNVTSFEVQILDPVTGKFIDNGQVRVRVPYVPLGEIEDTFVEITALGVTVQE